MAWTDTPTAHLPSKGLSLGPSSNRNMQFSSLPLELLHVILQMVPKGSLAPASLFLQRADEDEKEHALRLSGCVKRFCFESRIDEEELEQIELLEFYEPAVAELGRLWDVLPDLDSSTLPELPSLKGLGFFTSAVEEASAWKIMLNALSKLGMRTPMLQELILCPTEKAGQEELDQLLKILDHLPHLRRLVVHVQGCPANWSTEDVTQNFYQRTKASYPLLETEDNNPMLRLSL
ncbi:hypothetical protein RSAG8_03198, partial [Rhizoctonia solani AG-8 WAC10335]